METGNRETASRVGRQKAPCDANGPVTTVQDVDAKWTGRKEETSSENSGISQTSELSCNLKTPAATNGLGETDLLGKHGGCNGSKTSRVGIKEFDEEIVDRKRLEDEKESIKKQENHEYVAESVQSKDTKSCELDSLKPEAAVKEEQDKDNARTGLAEKEDVENIKPDSCKSEAGEVLDFSVTAKSKGTSDGLNDVNHKGEEEKADRDSCKHHDKSRPEARDSTTASCHENLPIDMSLSGAQRKQMPAPSQKIIKGESKPKSDNLRPVGKLLHDLGLDLVRQQVYKDLIGIQVSKDTKNMLDDKEKEQLRRLTDAHAKLLVKNAVFQIPFIQCRCDFSSSSANVMSLHHEFGSTFEVQFHACCMCDNFKTRWPSQFLSHLESHGKKGRMQSKLAANVCKYCPYEHKNQLRMEAYVIKCFKKFNLNTNLQPLPADCDVPLLAKVSQPNSSVSLRQGSNPVPPTFQASHGSQQMQKQVVIPSAAPAQPSVMEIGGQLYSLVQHNGKALFTSLRSQIANTTGSSQSLPSVTLAPANFPRFIQPPTAKPVTKDHAAQRAPSREKCEMCDAIMSDREALWNHFRMLHKVELSKVSMMEKEPWMTCDICMAKFWTYQGLTRHSVQTHKKELTQTGLPSKTFKCFLCLQVQANPLNHLSTYHNITLLDMYHSRRCCMCNKRFRAAPAFEEHMVLQHHDIFANKDVLCTVLQALSTALSLKRQETTQKPMLLPSSKFVQPIPTPNSNAALLAQARIMASSSCSSTARGTVPQSPSPSKAQPEVKKRTYKRQSGDRSKGNEASDTTKTTPKKSNEEDAKELNKLYADYADIGRPILRSMRHRLSQGGTEKPADASPQTKTQPQDKVTTTSTQPKDDLGESNDSGEPGAKKLCLEPHGKDVNSDLRDSESQNGSLQDACKETENTAESQTRS